MLLGPPGSGKGTQAVRLTRKFGIRAIATGEILRAQVEAGTPLGARLKTHLDRGQLAPDSLVFEIIRHRLADPDTQQGFVLDGFPRTVPQAQALDALLAELGRPIHSVLYLQVDQQALLDRLGHRAEVDQRSDDRPDVIAHRIDVFLDQTAPLIDYYRKQAKLRLIDGTRPPDVVAAAIDHVIRSLAAPGRPPTAG